MITSPAASLSRFENGLPYVVRWPAMATLPISHGSGVCG
jgi:hypothetical protein